MHVFASPECFRKRSLVYIQINQTGPRIFRLVCYLTYNILLIGVGARPDSASPVEVYDKVYIGPTNCSQSAYTHKLYDSHAAMRECVG